MKLWDAFLEDYGNEIHDWSPRVMLELFWEFCQDGNKAVAKRLNKVNRPDACEELKPSPPHFSKTVDKHFWELS